VLGLYRLQFEKTGASHGRAARLGNRGGRFERKLSKRGGMRQEKPRTICVSYGGQGRFTKKDKGWISPF
jgi:hypothetical protein